ncbi:MAG: sigma-70 family RNA polymerase sigma factor [Desulfobacteraceae bacterium]|jgi:RNA polymerase sigma-70 factor (ECF subfamily)
MSKITKSQIINDEDAELIRAINTGQVDLYHTLLEKYGRRLYNFGLKMCRDIQDAEDLVQDTFLNVFRYLKDFRFETKFRNWLYRIASSSCLKKKRRSKFAPEQELSLEEFANGQAAATSNELPLWAAQPIDKVLNHELGNTINNAILKLPKKYRMVLVLRDIEGFSTTEAAQILNLSEANIKVRLHRARLFLREELKGYFEYDKK